MYLIPYYALFPKQENELFGYHIHDYPELPHSNYYLLEDYCGNPNCNCQEVVITIQGEQQDDAIITFRYKWGKKPPKLYFEPEAKINTNSIPFWRDWLKVQLAKDRSLHRQFKAHYAQVRAVAVDATHPQYAKLVDLAGMAPPTPKKKRKKFR